MGWLYRSEPVRNVKDHITMEVFRCTTPGHNYEVLDSAVVGNTYYAAVRRILPDHAPYVFAAIILFRNSKSGSVYKDMDDSAGPCQVACPLRILKKLSKFEDMPGGIERRDMPPHGVTTFAPIIARKRRRPGARGRSSPEPHQIAQPLTFRSGSRRIVFTVRCYQRRGKTRTAFEAATRGCLCAIPRRCWPKLR